MKVIHLIGGGDSGGAKTHVLNLLKDLGSHIDVHLICFMRTDFADDAEKMGIPITVIEANNPVSEFNILKKLLKNRQVDLIHCHGAKGNFMGRMIRSHVCAPMVSTIHSDYRLDYLGRPLARFIYGTTYMAALRRADYYIGVSDPMTELLIDRNFPATGIYTIYNGIDFVTPLKFVSRQEFFSSIGFKVENGDIVAGIAARLSPVKDIPTLLRAMAIAYKKADNLKLVIAGDGEDAEKLKQMAAALGIAEKVCFAGWLSDINSFYNAIDINLLTSISETFPYALTEGTRMKKATVASRVGGVPVLIDHGVNGFIFTPGNAEELADSLLTLTENPELRNSFGTLLHKKASEMFSISKMIETQLEIYNSILHRHKRRKERKRDGIAICGAYGHGNIGDDAILHSIIDAVKKMDANIPITVFGKNPKYLKKAYRVDAIYSFNLFSVFNVMRKSLLYINGGGTLLQNITSVRSLFYYLFTIRLAKQLKNKVVMYGCGIGPVRGDFFVKYVKKVLNKNVDIITLREPHSLAELKSFSVTHPQLKLTSDPALVLRPPEDSLVSAFLETHNFSVSEKHVCFILRNWKNFEQKKDDIAKLADYLYKKHGYSAVFLSMNTPDNTANDAVRLISKAPNICVYENLSPEMTIGILSKMDLVISMRLHALIFASICGIPMVGLAYDPKINSFLDYLGYGSCIDLDSVNFDVLKESAEKELVLCSRKENLKQHAKRLAAEEKGNINAVIELLGE